MGYRFRVTLLALALAAPGTQARANVFNMTRFVQPDAWGLGIEGDLIFAKYAGMGAGLHYTHGVAEWLNLGLGAGYGMGPRLFRAGFTATFDIFPDIEGQVGIGLGTQAYYFQLSSGGQTEFTGAPYIHKTFAADTTQFEPFLAFPIGVGLFAEKPEFPPQWTPRLLAYSAFGSHIRWSEHFQLTIELGLALAQASNTYFSAGATYYY